MIGSRGLRPGDILTASNGKTIEARAQRAQPVARELAMYVSVCRVCVCVSLYLCVCVCVCVRVSVSVCVNVFGVRGRA